MLTAAITGANGFLGKHLTKALQLRPDVEVLQITKNEPEETLKDKLLRSDIIYHLAAKNRVKSEDEYRAVNVGYTKKLLSILTDSKKSPKIVFTSSIQATLNNEYGKSKKEAEDSLTEFSREFKSSLSIYRLPNVFGAKSRPEYNSVVATFCYNLTRNIPIDIHDPGHIINLVWVGDVIQAFLSHLDKEDTALSHRGDVGPIYSVSVGELAFKLRNYFENYSGSHVPIYADRFEKLLHSTLLSYYPKDELAELADMKVDSRGWLFELAKSEAGGQVFVSLTKPGITRGNHFHTHKIEKFCVVRGRARICIRDIFGKEIVQYEVNGNDIKLVKIPSFSTHSITNIGEEDLMTLFWSNEIFDPEMPDTIFEDVGSYEKN